jgi:hypothetical protein
VGSYRLYFIRYKFSVIRYMLWEKETWIPCRSTEWEEKREGYSPAPDASASLFEASGMTGKNQGTKIRCNDQDTRDRTNFKFQDTRRGGRRITRRAG